MSRRSQLIAILLLVVFAALHGIAIWNDPYVDNSDQVNIGIMALKRADPAKFATDYAFSDPTLFSFYTPLYLTIIDKLNGLTGSYDRSLAFLASPVLLVYLVGMYLLVMWLCESPIAAAAIAIFSSPQQWAIAATFWGAAGLATMLPRTLFIAAAPWLFWALFVCLQRRQFWGVSLLGFAGGLVANLHPVSGFHFIQLLTGLTFLVNWRNRRIIGPILVAAAAAVLGVWPTIVSFGQGTVSPRFSATEFERMYGILHGRLATLFPFSSFEIFGYILDASGQEVAVWAYLGALASWFFWRWRSGGRPRELTTRAESVLFLVFLMILAPMAYLLLGFHRGPLVLVVAVYALLVAWRRKVEDLDWWLGYLLALIIGCSFVAERFLDSLWHWLQWWGMTSLVGEQARMAQFVYLSLYAMAARCVQVLRVTIPSGPPRLGAVVLLLLLVAIPVRRDLIPQPWKSRGQAEVTARRDRQELYAWARSSTPKDSLFYHNELAFRFRAQRSITHCWKDLGLAYYSGERLLSFYERFEEFESASSAPGLLLSIARREAVDYIVLHATRSVRLEEPIAYQNASFIVYRCCLDKSQIRPSPTRERHPPVSGIRYRNAAG